MNIIIKKNIKKNKMVLMNVFLYILLFFFISMNFRSNVFAQEKEIKEEEFKMTKEE